MAWIIAGGLALAMLYHSLFTEYPYNSFLFDPKDRYNDFFNVFRTYIHHRNPYDSDVNVYFPFAFVPIKLLTFFEETTALNVLSAAFIVFTPAFVYRALSFLKVATRVWVTIALSFMTYPFLFVLDRGNLEALLFIFLAAGLAAFHFRKRFLSIVLISLAVAMKAYPGIYFLLFMRKKRPIRSLIKPGLLSVSLVAGITVLSALFITEEFQRTFIGLWRNLRAFKIYYLVRDSGMPYGSSLFSAVKLVLIMSLNWFGVDLGRLVPFLIKRWSLIALLLGAMSLYRLYRIRLRPWQNTAVLTFMVLLIPPVSFDYKLIHLLIPTLLFLRANEPWRKPGWSLFYTVGFGLLLIPKSYLYLVGNISINIVLNPLIMLLMMSGFFIEAKQRSAAKAAIQREVSRTAQVVPA